MFFIVAPMFFFVLGAIQIRDDDDDDIVYIEYQISCHSQSQSHSHISGSAYFSSVICALSTAST